MVISGGESSIEIAVDLARREAKIVLGVKDLAKGEEIIDEIIDRTGNTNVTVQELNLASFDSITSFVEHFRENEKHLDILINSFEEINSGQNEEGIEKTMLQNHYGHFLLTLLLLDTLRKSSPSRIVVKSSKLHRFSKKLPQDSTGSSSCSGYFKSKLANVLFTRHLAKKLSGTGVTVNCYHEGFTAQKVLPESLTEKINSSILEYIFKTPRSAAQTPIRLAVDPDLEGISGKFFADCEEMEPSDEAKNATLAEWLWKQSFTVTGTKEEDFF